MFPSIMILDGSFDVPVANQFKYPAEGTNYYKFPEKSFAEEHSLKVVPGKDESVLKESLGQLKVGSYRIYNKGLESFVIVRLFSETKVCRLSVRKDLLQIFTEASTICVSFTQLIGEVNPEKTTAKQWKDFISIKLEQLKRT